MLIKILALVLVFGSLGALAADFECPADFGYFPDPENCIYYYHCNAGNALRLKCQKKPDPNEPTMLIQLLYNENAVACEWPETVECGDRPECDEDNEDCHDHHITTPAPVDFDCPEENGYFGDPKNCIYYYICSVGVPRRQKCDVKDDPSGKPTQLLYNEDQVECDWPERVECGDRPECDEDNQDCEDHHITTEKPSDFNCPAEYGYFADPKNCIYYYHCDADTAVRLKCQKNSNVQLLYNEDAVQCDWPDVVECGNRPECDEDNEDCHEHHTTTPKPTACDGIPCPPDGLPFPEGPCEPCFCRCNGVHHYEQCCGAGLFFNPAAGACDWPFNNNACTNIY